MNEPIVLVGEQQTRMFRLIAMKHALRLEILGLKNSRGSVYALVKREFGFKGNKQAVLEQLTAHIERTQNT